MISYNHRNRPTHITARIAYTAMGEISRKFSKGNEESMKSDIHPNYDEATITCACGNVIKTRSTKKTMTVNTCSACHPYFTGAKTMVDTEGRVDSFKKRYAKFAK